MDFPVEVLFRHMPNSPAVETKIRQLATKLQQYHRSIMSAQIVVEAEHRHHNKGNLYHVRIDLILPGAELVASNGTHNPAHEDVYIAIRDAFTAIKKQLQSHVSRIRGNIKYHPSQLPLPKDPPLAEDNYYVNE